MAKIIVTIPRDQNKGVKVEVEGMVGPNCESLTAAIEAALGQVASKDQKDEYFHGTSQTQQHLSCQKRD